jgi:hypothetical protein
MDWDWEMTARPGRLPRQAAAATPRAHEGRPSDDERRGETRERQAAICSLLYAGLRITWNVFVEP